MNSCCSNSEITNRNVNGDPRVRRSPYKMLSMEQAIQTILDNTPLPKQQTCLVSLENSLGRVLIQDVYSIDPLPPFNASIKDGYAVLSSDGEGVFPVLKNVIAGVDLNLENLKSGTVVSITTGAPVPPGADAVVMIENTEHAGIIDGVEHVKILKNVTKGTDIRPQGCDIATNQLILKAGTKIGSAEIGLLATVGIVEVPVYNVPKIALLSTGDEVSEPHLKLEAGKIRDSNRPLLKASIAEASNNTWQVIDLGIASDSKEELEMKVVKGLDEADVIITSGGVSMGEMDLIKNLLEKKATVHFGRVLMKPGKPLTFATLQHNNEHKLIFGLPGNPVSSAVTFILAALPALRKLAGLNPNLPQIGVKLAQRLKLDPERPEYHRAIIRWDYEQNTFIAHSTGKQDSSNLLSMRAANCFLILPRKEGFIEVGEIVQAIIIGQVN
eukprot:TRINITY_DN178_c0_g1_i1.p1 TRINITY_DN178_c0_g1~~TRINITY_DN178_c0_g1_i1.p1  ORF type:complete len:441 (+),score=207.76 TRINITY_DN178_c0_g1_i1:77-1399(+)